MKLTIGVITHEPYMNNYRILIEQLVEQVQKFEKVEIVTLVQLEKESLNKYNGGVLGNEYNIREYVVAKTMLPSQARNFILEHSKGEWLAYIDGDCNIGRGYIEALYNAILNSMEDIGAIQGGIYANKLSKYGKYEYFYDVIALLEMGPEGSSVFFGASKEEANYKVREAYDYMKYTYIRKVQGFNFAVNRSVALKIGKFNVNIETAEDREFSARILENEYRILFIKDMEVYHDYEMSLKRIVRRKKWHAYGCAYMINNYNLIYKVDLKNRFLYMIDLFKICKSLDFLIYKISSEISFLLNLRSCIKKGNYRMRKE